VTDLDAKLSDQDLCDHLSTLPITDDETYRLAGSGAAALKGRMEAMKAERDTLLSPHRVAIEEIRERYNGWLAPMEATERIVKARMARLSDTNAANGLERPKAPSTGRSTRTHVEVVNFRELVTSVAEEQDYLRFLRPDQAELTKHVRKESKKPEGERRIPAGVKLVKETGISITPHNNEDL
jgi:hypothetical protein